MTILWIFIFVDQCSTTDEASHKDCLTYPMSGIKFSRATAVLWNGK